MHFLALFGAILAGAALLALGVLSVWHDLTARGPWEAPLVKNEESWDWSNRYRGVTAGESGNSGQLGDKSFTTRAR